MARKRWWRKRSKSAPPDIQKSTANRQLKRKNWTEEQMLSAIKAAQTGLVSAHRPPKVATQKGQRKVQYALSSKKTQVTVVGFGSATGQAIPPFVIFDAKQLNS